VRLLPDELAVLTESRETDERVKADRHREQGSSTDTSALIAELSIRLDDEGEFDPEGTTDARDRVLASVVRRRGQPAFREYLLAVYNMRCAISGCNVVPVLEAAHITPYLGPDTNRPGNGLLLRADLHTLFDLKMIAIDSDSMTVLVSSDLNGTCYEEFRGVPMKIPARRADQPSRAALKRHRERCGL
jgi:predicted restriction endonuclease